MGTPVEIVVYTTLIVCLIFNGKAAVDLLNEEADESQRHSRPMAKRIWIEALLNLLVWLPYAGWKTFLMWVKAIRADRRRRRIRREHGLPERWERPRRSQVVHDVIRWL